MIQFPYGLRRTGLHVLRSTCDEINIRRVNPPPPASDFRICTKLRIFAVPVFRNFAVPVFRVLLFLVLLIAKLSCQVEMIPRTLIIKIK